MKDKLYKVTREFVLDEQGPTAMSQQDIAFFYKFTKRFLIISCLHGLLLVCVAQIKEV